ncbi:MAG: ATP-binding protein [Gammaproteobacteria bacterium]|nr:ATP-binding protein [Gammaproteobacteria bacterium]
MKLKSATIREFKRFKDLTIQELPASAKLVVLLGPNGCGKSSLFDAFQRKLKVEQFYGFGKDLRRYYQRATVKTEAETATVSLEFHGDYPLSQEALKKSLYTRSSYRHDPSLQEATIQKPGDVLDRHTVRRLIDMDQTVGNNYQRIIWQFVRHASTPGLTTEAVMEKTIGEVQKSMKHIFGDIAINELVSDDERGTFTFSKGDSKNLLYEHLSAGEKAGFDLLLDILVNRSAFDDSLFCIDEPEAHLNAKVQRSLLEELYRLIPENSQLWIATHSIGMVRAALDMYRTEGRDHVVFLDMGFDLEGVERDYDQQQKIIPSVPGHRFWRLHYLVALDDMAKLLAPETIVLCEGSDSKNESLDEACYNRIFAREFPQTRFVSVGGASNVEKRMRDLLPVLEQIVENTRVILFRDRDDSTPEEVTKRRLQDIPVRTMSRFRNIESMLLSDGVLERLCKRERQPEKLEVILKKRDDILNSHQKQRDIDDFKPAAQAVHQVAKKELELTQAGESKDAFMRDILSPLIDEGTSEYQTLKNDIFGNDSDSR